MKIAVVGAGIAGLAFASAMSDAADVYLLDRMSEPRPVGAGIILYPNGSAALLALGLLDAVTASAAQLSLMKHRRYGDTEVIDLTAVWLNAKDATLGARRSELYSTLRSTAEASPRTKLLYGADVNSVSVSDDGTLSLGTTEGATLRNCDVVVAADGVNSFVRRALFPETAPIRTGLIYCRYIAHNVLGLRDWIVVDEEDASYGIYPVGDELVHSHIMFRSDRLSCNIGEEASFLSRCSNQWDECIAAVFKARLTNVHVAMAAMIRPPVWGRGRCIIIGDAAHSISPTLSEGGSLALEDGIVLANCLKSSGSIDNAIERFVSIRAGVVDWALRMATAQVRAPVRSTSPLRRQTAHSIAHMQRMYEPFSKTAALLTLHK